MSVLPSPAGQVIGRTQDVRLVVAALAENRLVTLIGSGGVGKTALAIEVAHEVEPEFGRVVTVGLVNAESRGEAIGLIGRAVLGEASDDLERVASALSVSPALLVLDNCEQAIDVLAEMVTEIVDGSPETRILATSRRPFELSGEVTVTVRPLAFPVDLAGTPIADFAAVKLFLERVRQADPTFDLTSDNSGLVGSICARADGVPLVLELAAALVRSHSLADIFNSMAESPDTLTANRRDLHDHQRSVAASLDWSRRFLSPDDQRLLGCLSTFSGGFTAEAARRLGGLSNDTSLTRLVDHSVVSFDRGSGRYHLLELIRADAQARFDPSEWDTVVEQHQAWCQDLSAEIGERLYQPDPDRVFRRYSQEISNLEIALRRCWKREAVTEFRELLAPMANWWVHHARPQGVERWAELLDADGVTDRQTLNINLALAYYWSHRGEYLKSVGHAELAEGLADRLDDAVSLCGALMANGNALEALGQTELAMTLHKRALEVGASSGEGYAESWARVNLARLDPGNAKHHLVGALEVARVGFTIVEALVLVELSRVAMFDSRFADAADMVDRGIEIMRDAEFGEGLATALNTHADVAVAMGRSDVARVSFGEALQIGQAIGHEGVVEAARDGLTDLSLGLHVGQASGNREVVAEALTDRELAVAFLLRGDLTQREIADELYIAPSTVKTHTKSIYRKLGVSKRSHAITRAAELGLFDR